MSGTWNDLCGSCETRVRSKPARQTLWKASLVGRRSEGKEQKEVAFAQGVRYASRIQLDGRWDIQSKAIAAGGLEL